MIVVVGFATIVATFLSLGVEDPTVVKMIQLEHKLDKTVERVTMNEEQIQQILATKYLAEPDKK
ncbi:MAG: hypothetical protein JXR12_01145 [Neptunomonas phycophila]|uniref:hypothetical protein n=1 Tax=Neptunomonas phycophila TaxID=1572645 RepID=UPI003B8C7B63